MGDLGIGDRVKLTKAQRAALETFRKGTGAPVYKNIRRDVARRLWELGLIEGSNGQLYLNAGYTVCQITSRGEAVLLKLMAGN